MAYVNDLNRVMRLDGRIYAEMMERGRSLRYSVINVAVLGLIYGFASLHFSSEVLARSGVADGHINGVLVVMVGVSVAFLLQGATALFIWVFCRALGGCPHFMPPYLNLGIAAAALWPLAPLVAMIQVGASDTVIQVIALAMVAYGLAVGYVAVQAAASLSRPKMILCAVATVFYIGCFLYLWT